MWNLILKINGVWLYLAKGGGYTTVSKDALTVLNDCDAIRLKAEYSEKYQTKLRHRLWL